MGSHVDYLRGHQRAKKVVSHSLGLVDFAIGLANSVLNLPDWQVKYFEEFSLQKNCEINSTHQKILGLVEMTFGLVNVSFSLPEWQAVKMTFFAPWVTQTTRWFFLLYLLNIYFHLLGQEAFTVRSLTQDPSLIFDTALKLDIKLRIKF